MRRPKAYMKIAARFKHDDADLVGHRWEAVNRLQQRNTKHLKLHDTWVEYHFKILASFSRTTA
jgi:hypothetical protein